MQHHIRSDVCGHDDVSRPGGFAARVFGQCLVLNTRYSLIADMLVLIKYICTCVILVDLASDYL